MPRALPAGRLHRTDEPALARCALAVAGWDEAAALHASRVPWDAPAAAVADLEARASSGALAVLAIERDGERIGSFFLKKLRRADGFRVLEIAGAYAHGMPEGAAIAAYLPRLEAFARALHCDALQAETSRPGIVQLLRAAGWGVSEVRLSKPLH